MNTVTMRKKLAVCHSFFIEENERDAVTSELKERHEATGRRLMFAKDERTYGLVEKGVLYVRRLFPVEEK